MKAHEYAKLFNKLAEEHPDAEVMYEDKRWDMGVEAPSPSLLAEDISPEDFSPTLLLAHNEGARFICVN